MSLCDGPANRQEELVIAEGFALVSFGILSCSYTLWRPSQAFRKSEWKLFLTSMPGTGEVRGGPAATKQCREISMAGMLQSRRTVSPPSGLR